MAEQSCLYVGEVMHRRLRPFRHRFAYRIFSALFDLDELPELDRRLRLFSHNSFNLFGFHDRDHGARDGSPLRPWIDRVLADHGCDPAGGQVRLLCFPRILGYVFNPLSIFFCYRRDGRLQAILYDVRNTFGDKHGYFIPIAGNWAPGAPIVQACDKGFHVSPFLPIEGGYRFRLKEPDQRLSILIRHWEQAGETLIATQTGHRETLSDARLLANFAKHPLMTVKVVAAIHWQALKIWLKGARFHRRPNPPDRPITLVSDPARVP